MTDKAFKKKLAALFERFYGPLEHNRYAFILMDTGKTENRIEYPGYNRAAQAAGSYNSKYLPGFNSCVKAVLYINASECVTDSISDRTDWREPFSPARDKTIEKDTFVGPYDDDLRYGGHIFLLIANSVLSDDFMQKKDSEMLDELIEYSRFTVEQLDTYGYASVSFEVIPEINGCLPEQIYTHTDKHLNLILEKIEKFGVVGACVKKD